MKTKKDQQQLHAKKRFAERLGVRLSQYLNDMLLNYIHTNRAKLVEKQSNRVTVFQVTFTPRPVDMLQGADPQELTAHIVYDRTRKTIVTVSEPNTSFADFKEILSSESGIHQESESDD